MKSTAIQWIRPWRLRGDSLKVLCPEEGCHSHCQTLEFCPWCQFFVLFLQNFGMRIYRFAAVQWKFFLKHPVREFLTKTILQTSDVDQTSKPNCQKQASELCTSPRVLPLSRQPSFFLSSVFHALITRILNLSGHLFRHGLLCRHNLYFLRYCLL